MRNLVKVGHRSLSVTQHSREPSVLEALLRLTQAAGLPSWAIASIPASEWFARVRDARTVAA